MTVSYEASDGFIKVNAPFRTVVRTLKQERKAFLPSFIERSLHGMNSSKASRHSAIAVTACNVLTGDSVSSISQRVKMLDRGVIRFAFRPISYKDLSTLANGIFKWDLCEDVAYGCRYRN